MPGSGEYWRVLESMSARYWRLLESIGEYWRVLESTGKYKCQVLHTIGAVWANIGIFKCIRIYLDEYIHPSKYLLMFPRQLYSDIHL